MKKNLLLIIGIYCFSHSLIAQGNSKWELNVNYAHQFEKEDLSGEMNQTSYSSDQIGVSINRVLFDENRFKLLGGVGYSQQQIKGIPNVIFCGTMEEHGSMSQGSHEIWTAEMPLTAQVAITKKIGVDIAAVSSFRFYQKDYYGGAGEYLLKLNAVEIYPSLTYQINKFKVALGGRMISWEMPDRIFYYDYSRVRENPDFYEKKLYRYNPLKLRLSAVYQF